ncbi:MAG: DUF4129 domain-containing protein [Verrucomicrobiaceae bacterium]
MELEKVTAEIRPRSEWEAVDLGLSLARAHLGTLWRAWLVTVLPMSLLIMGVFWKSPGWGVFFIWWLKPIWDRVSLFPLSRHLFGEAPNTKATIKVVPAQLRENWLLVVIGMVFSGLGVVLHQEDSDGGLQALFWLSLIGVLFYRSSVYRSFVLSVRFLEGLKGAAYRSRVSLLTRRSSGTAFALTLLCLLMEVGLFVSLFYLIDFMIPAGTEWDVGQLVSDFFKAGPDVLPEWTMALMAVAYVISMSLTSWFYAGGGFGLYVNSRTLTEGWDIELSFKRLGQRLGLLVLVLSLFGGGLQVEASTAEERINEVLASEDFEIQNRISRTKVEKEDDSGEFEEEEAGSGSDAEDGSGLGLFAGVGQLIFWAVVIVVVGGLVWLIVHNLQAFNGPVARGGIERKKVKTVAGMQITPESLPADILSVAKRLWAEGNVREAMGLLYRGAIGSLVARDLVEIEESDTESDCLRRLSGTGVSEFDYFELLTGTWIRLAYAKQKPEESEMNRLWNEWPFSGRGNG